MENSGSCILRGGVIVTADLSFPADLRIENGVIAEIGPSLRGGKILDATGCLVMPGGVDPHVHLDMPFMGTRSVDTFETGTRAALMGGTTTVLDFCLAEQGQSLREAFSAWQEKAKGACTDYGAHLGITWWSLEIAEEMGVMTRRGIGSFKHFMAYKGELMVNDAELFASFQRCHQLGALPMVHAENGDVVKALQENFLRDGKTAPCFHPATRPSAVEGEAVTRATVLAALADVPLYVVHVSSEAGHAALRRARQKGGRVYGEPLIQHLLLDESAYNAPSWDYAACHVMSPPFRSQSDRESLWAGLRAGSLQVVATDHCVFTLEQKRAGLTDFTRIPNGTGAVEERLMLLWTEGVGKGHLTPEEFVAVTSTNAAKIFNLYPRKGAVRVGSDADLVIWDPEWSRTLSAKTQHSAGDHTLFEGWSVKGGPRFTLSRGWVCAEEGRCTALPGYGRFVATNRSGS